MRGPGSFCARGVLRALPLVVLVAGGLGACAPPPPSITWVKVGPRCPSRAPEAVGLYFTRRAVPRPHAVVARYQIRSHGPDLGPAVGALLRRAAADGSDAVLLERGDGAAVTVWSWLLLFVPVSERAHLLHAKGLRYLPEGGGSCPRT